MQFTVYADLSRTLTPHERSTLLEALDRIVSSSGCVGDQGGATDEVYFVVESPSLEAASNLASRYMDRILEEAALNVAFSLDLR